MKHSPFYFQVQRLLLILRCCGPLDELLLQYATHDFQAKIDKLDRFSNLFPPINTLTVDFTSFAGFAGRPRIRKYSFCTRFCYFLAPFAQNSIFHLGIHKNYYFSFFCIKLYVIWHQLKA